MTTPVRAHEILKQDFLGADEVGRLLGIRFPAADLARLGVVPFPQPVLEEARGTHVLVAGAPLSLLDLRAGPAGRLLDGNAWYAKMRFAGEKTGARWHLMRKGIVPGSCDKTWDEQQALAAGYEVPRACELVLAVAAYYLARGVRLLDGGVLARCRDRVEQYGNVVDGGVNVGRFEDRGLAVEALWLNYRLHHLGVAATRTPPAA